MSAPRDPVRRRLLIAGSALAGGLIVGCADNRPAARVGKPGQLAPEAGKVALNGWVRVGTDGSVSVAVPRAEMGQGVHSALAMLVAEELDANWSRVSVEQAPLEQSYANTALFLNLVPLQPDDDSATARMVRASAERVGYALSLQVTGGSSSVRDAWEPMRLAGATARALLLQAAAQKWQVPLSECSTQPGAVLHVSTGRRLGYGELAAAAATQSPPAEVLFRDPARYRLIGKPTPRLDVPAKVDGSAGFGIDVRLPDMLYASIRQAPVFGAKLKSFDGAEALKLRGVQQVLAVGNGVVVVADSWWRANRALDAVKVEYDEGPNAGLDSAAISAQFRRDLDAASGFSFRSVGDAAAALAAATRKVEATYEVPFLAHATMEPMSCVAQVRDGRVGVWTGTQVATLARWKAAQVAEVATDKVDLHITYLGGGFGRRLETDMVEQAVAVALKTGGKPVKLLWSREEDTRHDMYRPAALSKFSAALDPQGRPTAWLNKVVAPSVGLDTFARLLPWAAADAPDKNQIEGAFDLPYAIDNLNVRQIRSRTPVPVGSWRSVGHSYNAFFTESFVDELAHAAGKDPLAFRRELLTRHPRHRAVLDLAAAKAGWGMPLAAGRARGVALHESFGSICAQVVEVSLEGGALRVHRVVCAIDCGVVVNPDTVEAQMQSAIVFGLTAALFGAITLKDGRVEQGSFNDYPMLQMAQMPLIETHLVPSTAAPGGVGEPGTPPIAPAVANALFALNGQRLRTLPLRPTAA
ncbi:xanthine dehydrogenase family protein molybdopterin-binding subunit [Rivibacter subsaxonicus]|uniref:Isoquinoline 1-oxidoreductase beta subunit n=1 Tax=Rivibacter subsaxonicus TaxID=457575 RepID=A0A4Q7VNC2_9BURK|nr:xanthine dehydrogenase family protein molybdopterin-binding subunit [Rivibacter subsaxonicus]RZT97724.1 isoquinoline 1-oxidoreductase beta subunit [Rivibacter subsaxonicus]